MKSLVGWWFVFLGTVCIGVAAWNGGGSIRLLYEGVSTEATVLSIKQERNRHSKEREMRNVALIEYKVDGKPLTFERSWSVDDKSSPNYRPADKLTVIYLPSDPSRASVYSLRELFLLSIIFGVVGLLFVGLGVVVARG